VRLLRWALGLTLLMSGCGGGSGSQPTDANRGDCNGSIRFKGIVYVVDSRLNQAAPQGRTIGPGAAVDCDHRTVVDRVVVSSVTGADTGLAIRVGHGAWHGVYVAENVRREEWPKILRQP
jgi:hypothetical protein